ncbi:MAG TPA: MaoC/PaaZ C-terminal domain-containing protein [Solirubrobacteraceae bacterium]|nr:MaoC/PaaZ C-terminal domain-containing protein [Solirubrobacteraceae bacterium]
MTAALWFEDLRVGMREVSPSRTITEADIVAFAGLSGDYHPLHTDAEYARRRGHRGVIAHGLLVTAVASGLFSRTDLSRGLQDATVALVGIETRLSAPTLAGDSLTVTAEVTELHPTRDGERGIVAITRTITNEREEVVQTMVSTTLIRREPDA